MKDREFNVEISQKVVKVVTVVASSQHEAETLVKVQHQVGLHDLSEFKPSGSPCFIASKKMKPWQIISAVDTWAQQNHRALEREFEMIYFYAKDNGSGWEALEKSDPESFNRALMIATENINHIPKSFIDELSFQ